MKEKISALIQRAEDALGSAELLLKEGYFDASVSRAYYSMFYATEAVLLTKDLDFSSHKSVISHFGKYFVKEGVFPPEMGKDLAKTFEKRLAGDYSFIPEIEKEEAEFTLEKAESFVFNIKTYIDNNLD